MRRPRRRPSDDDVAEEQDPVLRLAERLLEREPVRVLQPRGQDLAHGRITWLGE
ncbi:hypothetical protein [Nonomuraea aurantiaca]|uniref:hypothetical protein n=1 Tax=Nonomuraea aurantiaca TaxID=2878562 RepID=UPI001CDA0925|nr:hypothetical protein [Nonomuraea aurantiaca]MCA2225486.1 hypothetical protein [Nonomuraea aurantiaca]